MKNLRLFFHGIAITLFIVMLIVAYYSPDFMENNYGSPSIFIAYFTINILVLIIAFRKNLHILLWIPIGFVSTTLIGGFSTTPTYGSYEKHIFEIFLLAILFATLKLSEMKSDSWKRTY